MIYDILEPRESFPPTILQRLLLPDLLFISAIDGMKRSTGCSDVSRLWRALSANPSRRRVRDWRLLKRDFATTPSLRLRTSELSVSHLKDLKANADRLWNDIHHTA
jgi:hypothetical protein